MVDWKPFSPKALDFLRTSDARLNILHGSVRSSKTINCTVRWLTFIVSGPPGDLVMVGKTTATLQRNVLNDLFDIVGDKNYKWVNRQQGELRVFHRRIYCVGAANEDAESKIRGATFAGALCDEANLYPQSFWNQLMARCSVKGAQIFANCNPDSPYHWFYTDVITNEEIHDKKIWHFTMDDNLSLDPDYRKSLEQMYKGVFYQRFILGEWVVAEGRVYDMFDESIHKREFPEDVWKHPRNQFIVACDYGTSTTMSWTFAVRFPDGTYYKKAEYYYDAKRKGVQKADKEFGDIFDSWIRELTHYKTDKFNYNMPVVIYCDPSAASWKEELRTRGYVVQNADNDVINGIRFVASLLSQQKYFIDPSCTNTFHEYASYSWDANAQERGLDKPLKVFDHACDSDRYALYTSSQGAFSGSYAAR